MQSNQSSDPPVKGREFVTASRRAKQPATPFRLMLLFNAGLALSFGYGLLATGIVWYFSDTTEAKNFFAAYTINFKTIISLGLILGTALIVRRTQDVLPETVQKAFNGQLSKDYFYYRGRFYNPRVTLTFCGEFVIWGFLLFWQCQFPLPHLGQDLMLFAVCAEFWLAAYVGRKLMYSGMMLQSLLTLEVKRNLFRKRELDSINPYIHVASTLTVIFVYVHVRNYYSGQFSYGGIFGQSAKLFILVPAIIAMPVLSIFNFYPRAVLRKLYSKSIDIEIKNLKKAMRNSSLSAYEKRSYLLEVDKMSRDEVRYNLQLTLSDLPIGITILIMVLEPLLK